MREVQRRLGKILSTADLKILYCLYDYLALPAEVIMLLVSYCVEEMERKYGPGRKPRLSQVRREGFAWKRLGVLASEMESAALFAVAAARRVRCGSVFHVIWNQEREKAGLDQKESHDTSSAIRAGVEALKLLILKDLEK